jgi:hypothetical protein
MPAMNEHLQLTADRFDAIATKRADRVIWTAAAIGHCVGCSPDFIRRQIANLPDSPVKKIAGRYCALESELMKFFRPR